MCISFQKKVVKIIKHIILKYLARVLLDFQLIQNKKSNLRVVHTVYLRSFQRLCVTSPNQIRSDIVNLDDKISPVSNWNLRCHMSLICGFTNLDTYFALNKNSKVLTFWNSIHYSEFPSRDHQIQSNPDSA